MKHKRWLRKRYRIGKHGIAVLKQGKKHIRIDNRASIDDWYEQINPFKKEVQGNGTT